MKTIVNNLVEEEDGEVKEEAPLTCSRDTVGVTCSITGPEEETTTIGVETTNVEEAVHSLQGSVTIAVERAVLTWVE